MYSCYYSFNPKLMVKWYDSCVQGDWNEAVEIHKAAMRYKAGFLIRYNREGWFSAAKDKIWPALNPHLKCTYRGRYPYECAPPEVLEGAMQFMRRECPKLLEGMEL